MRKLTGPFCLMVAAVLGLGFGQPADAAFTEFFGQDNVPGGTVPAGGAAETARNNFLAGLSGVGTEDFEGFAGGTSNPLALSFPGSVGGITATLSGGGATVRNFPGAGRFATSGTNYVNTTNGGDFTVAFSSAISAFGFYGTDIGDIGGNLILTLTNGSTKEITLTTGGSPNGSLLYYGFIDTSNAYTSIAFTNTGSGDVFGFDDMTIGDRGQVILPEPTSMALFGLGALAVAGASLRRKRK